MNLNRTEQAIALLHLPLGDQDTRNAKPLSLKEWNQLGNWLKTRNLEPSEFLLSSREKLLSEFTDDSAYIERIVCLLNRGTALGINLERWERAGVWLLFRANKKDYPAVLRKRLKLRAPIIFFGVGDLNLVNEKFVGIVGSRNPAKVDLEFTESFTKFLISKSYNVVSGGAKGIDLKATLTSIENGGKSVVFLGDSLLKRSVSPQFREMLQEKKLLLLSSSNPESPFHVGLAMQRNKYIYCMAEKVMIVTCTVSKGGTWEGAIENYKNKWVEMFVHQSEDENTGNKMLEKYDARPLQNDINSFNEIFS